MTNKRPKGMSTSALARQLGLPNRDLFTLLKELGWIKHSDEGWLLTGKGEFEGGQYVHSDRFGRYIVWPESILEHTGFQNASGDMVISASSVGNAFDVSGRYMNHVLHELGWIKPGIKGWRITEAGQGLGGVEIEDEETCIPYVKWPPDLIKNKVLEHALANSYGTLAEEIPPAAGDDLFASQPTQQCTGIDGHPFEQPALAAICNWLYYAGLSHACGRIIPGSNEHAADFYLPSGNLYIEYWGEQGVSGSLSGKLAKKEFLEAQGLPLIELQKEDIAHLDEVLPRELFRHGITVY